MKAYIFWFWLKDLIEVVDCLSEGWNDLLGDDGFHLSIWLAWKDIIGINMAYALICCIWIVF